MDSLQVSNKQSEVELLKSGLGSSSRSELVVTAVAIRIFLRSLFISAAFNYRGMQNLGFIFTMLPLAKQLRGDKERLIAFLVRHFQLFNTHPYLSAAVIGSVVRGEMDGLKTDSNDNSALNLKNALAGPYAALGDSFFWGAMKPLAAVFSVLLAWQSSLLASVALLILYDPAHLWVRIRGFMEGYRGRNEGIDFIRRLDLPLVSERIRWLSLLGLIAVTISVCPSFHSTAAVTPMSILTKSAFLFLIILCYWGIKNGISQVKMLYLMFVIGFGLSS